MFEMKTTCLVRFFATEARPGQIVPRLAKYWLADKPKLKTVPKWGLLLGDGEKLRSHICKAVICWLLVTGTMEWILTFHSVGNFIIPIDFHVFQRGGSTTNQYVYYSFTIQIKHHQANFKSNWDTATFLTTSLRRHYRLWVSKSTQSPNGLMLPSQKEYCIHFYPSKSLSNTVSIIYN